MPYRPTGVDRDSYISGVRTGKYGAVHDVNQRRDNLPDNVFNTVRDGVMREERLRQNEEEARARVRLELAKGKGGKRLAGGGAGDQKRAMEAMEKIHETGSRHEALEKLYAEERAQWEVQLGSIGLAIQ